MLDIIESGIVLGLWQHLLVQDTTLDAVWWPQDCQFALPCHCSYTAELDITRETHTGAFIIAAEWSFLSPAVSYQGLPLQELIFLSYM